MLIISIGFIPLALATSGVYWTKSYPLSAGLGAMHEIQVENGAELVLHSPPGSNYDLYAVKNSGPFGSCPSNNYIMSHADKSTAGMPDDVLLLESGLWCLIVYAQSGSGTYLLEASSAGTDEGMFLIPTPGGDDGPAYELTCIPYRTSQFNGVIEAGTGSDVMGVEHMGWLSPEGTDDLTGVFSLNTSLPFISDNTDDLTGVFSLNTSLSFTPDNYHFQVGGERSHVEIILLGPCVGTVPDQMLTDSEVQSLRMHDCGMRMNMEVFENCDPINHHCSPLYSSESLHSNEYVKITDPGPGNNYYVTVRGLDYLPEDYRYRILVRSYQCWY